MFLVGKHEPCGCGFLPLLPASLCLLFGTLRLPSLLQRPEMQDDAPPSLSPAPPPGLAQRLAAEAIGTGAIVAGGCGAVCAATYVPGYALGPLGCSLAFGASVALAVYATRDISGAHLNPAITGMLVVHRPGAISQFDAACYAGAQITGGAIAAVRRSMANAPGLT